MKVRDAMSENGRLIHPDQTIRQAAMTMSESDVGALPVGGEDRLLGMITDRAIALGCGSEPAVKDMTSHEVKYCDEDIDSGAENMADIQVRRLPVINQAKQLVGIISTANIATSAAPSKTGEAVAGICLPPATATARWQAEALGTSSPQASNVGRTPIQACILLQSGPRTAGDMHAGVDRA